MEIKKNTLFFGLIGIAGIFTIAVCMSYLSKTLNINIEPIFPILSFLFLLFLVDLFESKNSRKGFWEIVSYSSRDRILFLSLVVILTFFSGYIDLIKPKLAYRLFLPFLLLFGSPYILVNFSSPEIREELKGKFRIKGSNKPN